MQDTFQKLQPIQRIRHEKTHDKDDVHCHQCNYGAKYTTSLAVDQAVKHVKRESNFKCG